MPGVFVDPWGNTLLTNVAKQPRLGLQSLSDFDLPIVNEDAFDWLKTRESNSIHAVVTDPPYGVLEYSESQLSKMRGGRGGVWRHPASFDNANRKPVPRFTILTDSDKRSLSAFFREFADLLMDPLVPGAHVFIATNPLISQYVYMAFIAAGFEKRGEIIRVVQTLRGGDRPKNAHEEFDSVTVMPRSCWEPWGLFRKPCEGRVQDNLRRWGTGGLKRLSAEAPFRDLIVCPPAGRREVEMAPHPSLKPQRLMRQLVRAALPMDEGVIVDPFMGSGSTIAAAMACGVESIGVEVDAEYFELARNSIPLLAEFVPNGD